MKEYLPLALPLATGLLLGLFFFGGLWWTIIKGVSSPRPVLWFFGSMMLRMGVTMSGLYYVAREDWTRWLSCLLGFIVARMAVKWLTAPRVEPGTASTPEASYAP